MDNTEIRVTGFQQARGIVLRYLARRWGVSSSEAQCRIGQWLIDNPDPNDPPSRRTFDSLKATANDARMHHQKTRGQYAPQVALVGSDGEKDYAF